MIMTIVMTRVMIMMMTMMLIIIRITNEVWEMITTETTITLKIIPSRSLSFHNYHDCEILINVFSKVPEMVNRMTGVDVTNVRTIHEKYL